MTPSQIVDVLESRGWTAEIVNKVNVPDLVDVNAEGLFKCVDGRCSDHHGMRGPKVLGGVYGVAATRSVLDLDGLTAIVHEVADAGYVPSVHGDEHADPAPMGCGFFKLWSKGQLPGLEKPDYDSLDGKDNVRSHSDNSVLQMIGEVFTQQHIQKPLLVQLPLPLSKK